MIDTNPVDLELRLHRIEAQFRRVKRLGCVLLGAAGATLLMGQACQSKTVEAGAFLLKDDEGKTRASMRIVDGLARLTISDAAAQERIVATVDENNIPTIDLYDSGLVRRASLRVPDGKDPEVETMGLTRAYQKDGSVLALYDRDGNVRTAVAVMMDGGASIVFRDEEEKQRGLFGLGSQNNSVMIFTDAQMRPSVSLIATEANLTGVFVTDPQGAKGSAMMAFLPGVFQPYFAVVDQQQKVRFKAP